MADDVDENLDPDETGLLSIVRTINRMAVPIVERRLSSGWIPNEAPPRKLSYSLCTVCAVHSVEAHEGEICERCRNVAMTEFRMRELGNTLKQARYNRIAMLQSIGQYLPLKGGR